MKITVYIAKGDSMRPTVNNNDFIFTKSITFDEGKNGDIGMYEYGGKMFLHRVLSKDKYGVVVGSDSDSVDKHYVKRDYIIGIAITSKNPLYKILPFIFKFLRKIKRFGNYYAETNLK